jgi:hypothetical protein
VKTRFALVHDPMTPSRLPFELDICNMTSPLFTGLRRALQDLLCNLASFTPFSFEGSLFARCRAWLSVPLPNFLNVGLHSGSLAHSRQLYEWLSHRPIPSKRLVRAPTEPVGEDAAKFDVTPHSRRKAASAASWPMLRAPKKISELLKRMPVARVLQATRAYP